MTGPSRWSRVDRVMLMDKHFLSEDDVCFYYLQVDTLRWWVESPHQQANSLMDNFKKSPTRYANNLGVLGHKREAVKTLAKAVASFLTEVGGEALGPVSLVPIPTSRPRGSEGYDSRLDDLCQIVSGDVGFASYLPLLDTVEFLGKTRYGEVERDPNVLARNIRVAAGALPRCRETVVLVDDVLVTGSHFAACKALLDGAAPVRLLVGLFLSSWVPKWAHPSPDDYPF